MGVIENRIDITELERSGGGGGGTAADVTYDNTTSHMTATDVQAALDELHLDIAEGLALVNTSVAVNRDAILGLEGDIADSTFLVSDLTETISDFANTDTLPELFGKIITHMNAVVASLDEGESIEIQSVDLTGIGTLEVKNKRLINTAFSAIYAYSFVAGSTQLVNYVMNILAASPRAVWSRIAYADGTTTAGEYDYTVAISTYNISGASVRYRKYKTV